MREDRVRRNVSVFGFVFFCAHGDGVYLVGFVCGGVGAHYYVSMLIDAICYAGLSVETCACVSL